jgi:hypothetical protein
MTQLVLRWVSRMFGTMAGLTTLTFLRLLKARVQTMGTMRVISKWMYYSRMTKDLCDENDMNIDLFKRVVPSMHLHNYQGGRGCTLKKCEYESA